MSEKPGQVTLNKQVQGQPSGLPPHNNIQARQRFYGLGMAKSGEPIGESLRSGLVA